MTKSIITPSATSTATSTWTSTDKFEQNPTKSNKMQNHAFKRAGFRIRVTVPPHADVVPRKSCRAALDSSGLVLLPPTPRIQESRNVLVRFFYSCSCCWKRIIRPSDHQTIYLKKKKKKKKPAITSLHCMVKPSTGVGKYIDRKCYCSDCSSNASL